MVGEAPNPQSSTHLGSHLRPTGRSPGKGNTGRGQRPGTQRGVLRIPNYGVSLQPTYTLPGTWHQTLRKSYALARRACSVNEATGCATCGILRARPHHLGPLNLPHLVVKQGPKTVVLYIRLNGLHKFQPKFLVRKRESVNEA